MIPTEFSGEDYTPQLTMPSATDAPTLTYGMVLDRSRMRRKVDGQDAMRQAIFKILQTERYSHPEIYSDNYGSELLGLIGTSVVYAIPEITRRITEALTWDPRISEVTNFEFVPGKNEVLTKFTARTVFGDIEIDNFKVSI